MTSDGPMQGGGRPRRRRDAAASRRAIESAARRLFASRGYALTGVRDIAGLADVNSALVGRYFGTKEALFRTIVGATLDLRPLLAGPHAGFGTHAVAILRASHAVPSPLAMMLLSMGDPGARAVSIELMERAVVAPLADWLGAPDAVIRARRLCILWAGYLTQIQLLPGATADEVVTVERWLARATQAIVDEAVAAGE